MVGHFQVWAELWWWCTCAEWSHPLEQMPSTCNSEEIRTKYLCYLGRVAVCLIFTTYQLYTFKRLFLPKSEMFLLTCVIYPARLFLPYFFSFGEINRSNFLHTETKLHLYLCSKRFLKSAAMLQSCLHITGNWETEQPTQAEWINSFTNVDGYAFFFGGGGSAVSYWSSYPLRCVYRGQGIKLWRGELNAFSFKFFVDLDHTCKVWAAPECISPCLKEEGKEEEQEPVNIKHWEEWETKKMDGNGCQITKREQFLSVASNINTITQQNARPLSLSVCLTALNLSWTITTIQKCLYLNESQYDLKWKVWGVNFVWKQPPNV